MKDHENRLEARGTPVDGCNGRYADYGRKLGETCDEKHAAYGEGLFKVGEVLKIMFPSGIPNKKIDDFAVAARILDKLFRKAAEPPFGDSMGEDPWADIAGYAIIMSEKNARPDNSHKATGL
jgi:hypothetical protein